VGDEIVTESIFLSASVPDPKRAPDYAKTADVVAITAAITALVYVTLGRRLLVWGGHPAITPMVWIVAESMGVDYGRWVKLYQSRYFDEDFPEENERFQNVTFTESVEGDRDKSLRHMREQMFTERRFKAAVFIGGMSGIIQEYELLKSLQPEASVVPVISTGGAVLKLPARSKSLDQDLGNDFDYISLFHRHLQIDKRELRYSRPEEQPEAQKERLWSRSS
jgi:hypothetical protein